MTGNSRGKKKWKGQEMAWEAWENIANILQCVIQVESLRRRGGGGLLEPSNTPECKDSKCLRIFH